MERKSSGSVWTADRIFYKHEISENLSRDAYSMHTHSMYELIYFEGGDATHVIEDRKYKLKKGDLILIRPFQYHFIQIDASTDYKRYDILFDPEKHRVEGVELLPPAMEVIHLSGHAIAEEIFRRCDFYHKQCDAETFDRVLPHLLSELFYTISVLPSVIQEGSASVSPMISGALRYINENLCTIGGIDAVARHLFISESYLFRLFKTELHQSPRRYIMEKRLWLAQRKLTEGQKPTEISEACGFRDYTTFYRNYTAFFGHSPVRERWIKEASEEET